MTTTERFHIRPYRPSTSDRAACSHICVCTGDSGKDARGLLSSDEIYGEIWVLPYVDRHPEYAWVVEDSDGDRNGTEKVVGYVVGAPDTTNFDQWYHDSYWPSRAARFGNGTGTKASEKERGILEHASSKGGAEEGDPPAYLDSYPAHLHINLLPQAQGQGLGKRMIHTLWNKMGEDGVKGLHLGAAADNADACAFYKKIGMSEAPCQPGERVFVKGF